MRVLLLLTARHSLMLMPSDASSSIGSMSFQVASIYLWEATTWGLVYHTCPLPWGYVVLQVYQGLTEGLVRLKRGVDPQGGQDPPNCL